MTGYTELSLGELTEVLASVLNANGIPAFTAEGVPAVSLQFFTNDGPQPVTRLVIGHAAKPMRVRINDTDEEEIRRLQSVLHPLGRMPMTYDSANANPSN